ncbi:MAG TPA: amidohydrolase family protein [Rudaea sp.]|nr:amidohydrolase family protein [Rudaea sp.]
MNANKMSFLAAAVIVGAMSTASAQSPAATAATPDVLIRGAKVYTVSARGTLDNADVLVRGGKIAAVVESGAQALQVPAGTRVVEAHGRALTPGMFAGLSHIGLEEISAESSTVDARLDFKAPAWDQKWRPEFDVTLAYNPRSTLIPVARVEGLTWTVLEPDAGDSIIAGQGAAVVLDGRLEEGSRATLSGSRSLFVELGSAAEKLSGGSRAAAYMLLDQAISEAHASGPTGQDALLHAAGRTALARYLSGGRVVFEVERATDILEVLAFAERNHVKPVIAGGSEAWLVASALARAHAPVILNSLQDLPSDFDRLSSRLDNAARLQRAGVLIAFSSGDSHNARTVRQLAGNAVAHGLPWDAALAAVTANPAEIFGQGAARGRIEKGQVADLVLWSGDPLEVTSAADQVWIDGRAVEMRSRQTELRDRYLHRAAAR